jgi:hypothetical protein
LGLRRLNRPGIGGFFAAWLCTIRTAGMQERLGTFGAVRTTAISLGRLKMPRFDPRSKQYPPAPQGPHATPPKTASAALRSPQPGHETLAGMALADP